MKLTFRQIELNHWSAANILCGKTMRQDHKNYILSRMLHKRLGDKRPKLNIAIANHMGPLP